MDSLHRGQMSHSQGPVPVSHAFKLGQVAYEDVRKAVKLKSLNRGYRTPDPSPTRDADAEKEGLFEDLRSVAMAMAKELSC